MLQKQLKRTSISIRREAAVDRLIRENEMLKSTINTMVVEHSQHDMQRLHGQQKQLDALHHEIMDQQTQSAKDRATIESLQNKLTEKQQQLQQAHALVTELTMENLTLSEQTRIQRIMLQHQ